MFIVSTVNLSSDTTNVDPELGTTELGELSDSEFTSLLYRFRLLDPVQNTDADPHLLVSANAGRFIIRTGQGKLFLYNARDTTEPYAELSPEEIIAQLDHRPAAAPLDLAATPPEHKPAPHYGIAIAILFAGLALNAYTLYSVFYTETVVEQPSVTLLTDPAELAARQREVIGTFATGAKNGDRVITIDADGSVRFSEIGSRSGISTSRDTFRLGRHDRKLCLVTTDSGVVDIAGVDTLVYYRDTYRRTK